MFSRLVSVLCIAALSLSASVVAAHSGETDSSGCHRESATGLRNCHTPNSGSDDTEWGKIGLVLVGVVGVYYAVRLLTCDDRKTFAELQDDSESRPLGIQFTRVDGRGPIGPGNVAVGILRVRTDAASSAPRNPA